jgi:predicted  nucleic acid-binding Zn-ribbon protein
MGIWRCTKCGTVRGGVNKPLVGVCPKGGGHRWGLGADSKTKPSTYQCGKCGTITTAQSKPLDRNCVKGGRCTWRKYHT